MLSQRIAGKFRLIAIVALVAMGVVSLPSFARAADEKVKVTSPSGHEAGDGNGIALSIDGDKSTKWCVQSPGDKVIWLAKLPKEQEVKSYSLTSGDDLPERDPQVWVVEGSKDGTTWVELDRQKLTAPFEDRAQTTKFTIAKSQAFTSYRFTFVPTKDVSHFQVAEIELEGVKLANAAN